MFCHHGDPRTRECGRSFCSQRGKNDAFMFFCFFRFHKRRNQHFNSKDTKIKHSVLINLITPSLHTKPSLLLFYSSLSHFWTVEEAEKPTKAPMFIHQKQQREDGVLIRCEISSKICLKLFSTWSRGHVLKFSAGDLDDFFWSGECKSILLAAVSNLSPHAQA